MTSFIVPIINHTFITPTQLATILDASFVTRAQFNPLSHSQRQSINSQHHIRPTIATLAIACRPFQVAFFVMTIIINSIQRMFIGWTESHFCKKFFKRIKAKLNTSFTIMRKVNIVGVITSRTSTAICRIFRSGLGIAQRMPVCYMRLAQQVMSPASARFSWFCNAFQSTCGYFFNNTTFTFAKPKSGRITDSAKSDYGQSSIYHSCQILESAMSWQRLKFNGIFSVIHSVFSFQKIVWARIGQGVQALDLSVFSLTNLAVQC